jgi:hypothetical protein
LWTLSQPQKALWLTLKFDCRVAQLRTGTSYLIHAGALLEVFSGEGKAAILKAEGSYAEG